MKNLVEFLDINYFTAPITLLEFQSKIGLLRENNNIEFYPEFEEELSQFSTQAQIKLITEYCFKQMKIKVVSNTTIENFSFNQEDLQIEDTLTLAFKFSTSLSLRSLDLIQIACALKIKLISNIEIQYFLTNDERILNRAQKIYQKTRIMPIGSENLIKILKNE